MYILGIDPGLNITGYGVIRKAGGQTILIEGGVIRPGKEAGSTELPPRLVELHNGIAELLRSYPIEAVALEELYAHYAHPRTAIIMGHARGVIMLAAAQTGLKVSSYTATQIKKTITGHGRASKEQMQLAIVKELNLPKIPEPYDVTDALAVAVCHAFLMDRPEILLSTNG